MFCIYICKDMQIVELSYKLNIAIRRISISSYINKINVLSIYSVRLFVGISIKEI